jgi:putative ABC transport system permease protein
VTPTDPLTFIVVPLVFIVAALVASYLPARRAASIAPVEALRCE